jgi:hypothetical protein
MVKIILILLVILIIVLVANGLGVVNEGFIQCIDKSSYTWGGDSVDIFKNKRTDCRNMNGCKWEEMLGFDNSGSCLDTCPDRDSQLKCESVNYCEYKDSACKRKDIPAPTAAPVASTAATVVAAAAAPAETEAAAGKCDFVPWGDTIRSCIDRCASIEDRDHWGGKACTDGSCYKICKKCTNSHCKWNKKKISTVSGERLVVPLKQTVKAVPADDKIQLLWRVNETENNLVTSFLIYYYKTYGNNNSVFTQKVIREGNKMNYDIILEDNIQENQYYTIGVYAVNSMETGPISNLERVKTDELTTLLFS